MFKKVVTWRTQIWGQIDIVRNYTEIIFDNRDLLNLAGNEIFAKDGLVTLVNGGADTQL